MTLGGVVAVPLQRTYRGATGDSAAAQSNPPAAGLGGRCRFEMGWGRVEFTRRFGGGHPWNCEGWGRRTWLSPHLGPAPTTNMCNSRRASRDSQATSELARTLAWDATRECVPVNASGRSPGHAGPPANQREMGKRERYGDAQGPAPALKSRERGGIGNIGAARPPAFPFRKTARNAANQPRFGRDGQIPKNREANPKATGDSD